MITAERSLLYRPLEDDGQGEDAYERDPDHSQERWAGYQERTQEVSPESGGLGGGEESGSSTPLMGSSLVPYGRDDSDSRDSRRESSQNQGRQEMSEERRAKLREIEVRLGVTA